MPEQEGRFVLVVNPQAGAGKAARKLPGLEAALREGGANFEVKTTEGPGHATTLVRQSLEDGAPGIAVVGGDGTLNEAVNGFFSESGEACFSDRWLGPLPVGTGGDFRRTLGISKSVNAMATRMLWAKPRPVDVGWLSFVDHQGDDAHRAFINIASFGMGGKVDELVNETPKWMGGTPAFFLGTLRAMAVYRNQRVKLIVDEEETHEAEVVNVAVANGQYFGGGMHIAPKAAVDDGLFDIVSLEGLTAVDQLRLTPHLYRGTLLEQPGVWYRRAKRLEAMPIDDAPVLLDVDGEAPGQLPAVFELKANALKLRA